MPSVIYQKPVCQRDIYQKSPNIFGSSNEKQVHLRSIKLPRIHLFYPCCLCPQPQGHRFSGCRSDLTDMPRAQRVVAPSRYFVPWAALISRWPLPQQLLPVSATGRGHRRCPPGELSAKQTERATDTRRCRAAGPSGRQPAPAGKWAVRAHRRCSCRSGSPAPAPAGRSSGRRPSPFPA